MFTTQTLSFLRRLRRHNDRAWFQAHRDEYETHVRAPMLGFIEHMHRELPSLAPDLQASPKISLYRIHRDTRFSANKAPYKSHVAAIFPHRILPKHVGAGLYLEVSPDRVLIGGGVYAPDTQPLSWIRNRLDADLDTFRAIVESASFRRTFGTLDGERLLRVPRGFPADHPGAEYLRLKQFLAGSTRPPESATSPRFRQVATRVLRQVAPLVAFLNDALMAGRESVSDPLL